MHPLLENLSIYTWMDIINSNDVCISLLQDLGLIPARTDVPPACPKCSGSMFARNHKHYILGWHWTCKKRKGKSDRCYGTLNPLEGTFFENSIIPITDALALIFGYFLRIGVKEIQDHIHCWRKSRQQKNISPTTIIDVYARCKEIIFIALRKRGKDTEYLEKADLTKLFKTYSKTLEIAPVFRYLVYHFLMDLKTACPCLGTKAVQGSDDVHVPASTFPNSSSVNAPIEKESESNLVSSTNSLSDWSSIHKSKNVRNAEIPNRISTTLKNPNLSNCADVSTADASIEIRNEKISNCNTVGVINVQTASNKRPDLENVQSVNSNTVGVVNIQTPINKRPALKGAHSMNSNIPAVINVPAVNKNIATLDNVKILSSTTTDLENPEPSENNATVTRTVQISYNNSQSLNSNTSTAVSMPNKNKNRAALDSAQISNSITKPSSNNVTAIENVQISDNKLDAVSSPSIVVNDFLSENLKKEAAFLDIIPFSDENMDIIEEVVVETTE